MRCEYLAYKVAQVWRISMQRGWEGSSGKLFPGLLSLRCCSFGCSWTVSMHLISQRSHVWGSELKAHQTHCTGHEPVCLESKNYIHHWIFLRAFGSASQTTSSLETSGSTQPKAGGRAAHGHGCTSKWDVLGQSWSCMPSIRAVSWYNTSCIPIITLFSCSEHGGHMLTAHWKWAMFFSICRQWMGHV